MRSDATASRLLVLAIVAAAAALTTPIGAIVPLSDEFEEPGTIADWPRVHETEQWNADQLEAWDVDQTAPGWMHMMPYTSTWYQDYRGVLAYKPVEGDFVATTRVRTRRRSGSGAPQVEFSLAGILVREPRNVTPATWTTGGENYVFLSHGTADMPGTYQYEVKTTIDSVSILEISAAPAAETLIQTARIGPHFILLRQEPGDDWAVHRRYHRPDFSATLQVGLTVYTDWPFVQANYPDPFVHNQTVITDGNPDLVAEFDYVRFQRPQVPPELAGRDFSAPYDPGDPTTVSDDELLTFLGELPAARIAIFSDGFESGDTSAWP